MIETHKPESRATQQLFSKAPSEEGVLQAFMEEVTKHDTAFIS